MKRPPAWPAALIASLLASACTTLGPNFSRPEIPWLAGWAGGSLESSTIAVHERHRPQTEEWWRTFNDPVLDQLVAEAQRVNPGVRTAGMRIMEARAQLGIAGSGLYPQLQQVTGGIVRARRQQLDTSGPDSPFTAYDVGVNIAWELDFWGKFRRGIESADAGRSISPRWATATSS